MSTYSKWIKGETQPSCYTIANKELAFQKNVKKKLNGQQKGLAKEIAEEFENKFTHKLLKI
jgi:hypothetical protein